MSPTWYYVLGFLCIVCLAVAWRWGRKPSLFYFAGMLSVIVTIVAVITYDTKIRLPAVNEAHEAREVAIEQGEKNVTEDDFFIFVGQPVSVVPAENPNNEGAIIHYDRYDLTYRVLESIWGSYNEEVISFSAYDHYGRPPFVDYRHVMIFAAKHDGNWVHELYQWFPVYKTIDGEWAFCGNPLPDNWEGDAIELQKIQFEPPVYSDTTHLSEEAIAAAYPEPTWTIQSDKAFCSMGTYTDELFRIKREGVLHARGLF